MNDITEKQSNMMEHAIGLWISIIRPEYKFFKAYRNCYVVHENTLEYKLWQDLENRKLAKEKPNFGVSMSLFQVTTKGIKFLSNKYKIKIIQDKEDIVEVDDE